MRTIALLLLLVCNSALAQEVRQGGALRSRVYATSAALTLYVDPAGSDTSACTGTGTAACLTIQGALQKVPKLVRNQVTINVAAGNYAGAVITGFTQDTTFSNASPTGLLIQGTLANSTTLATGTATGTATSGTAGSIPSTGIVNGTLTDSGQSWTANNLRGRFISITSGTGSGQLFVISENTATTLTIAGTWTAPTGTSVYAIQDAASVITSGATIIPRADGTGSLTGTAFTVSNNSFRNLRGIILKNFRSTLTNSFCVAVQDGTPPAIEQFQNVQTGTVQPFRAGGTGYLGLTKVYSKLPAGVVGSQVGTHVGGDGVGIGTRLVISNSVIENGQYAMNCTGVFECNVSTSEIWTTDRGLSWENGANGGVASSEINCAGGAGQFGMVVAERHDGATATGSVTVASTVFKGCSYAIEQGGGNLWIVGASGLTGRAALNLRGGGKVTVTSSGTTTTLRGSDGGLYDFTMDAYGAGTAVQGAWSDFLGVGDGGTVGSCIGTLAGASSICTQP